MFILEGSGLKGVLAQNQERKILDVGCGGGQVAIQLKGQYPHLQITGVDLSADQVARARKRSESCGLEVQFEAADAQNLPFADESFHVVVSFGSAKHWPDQYQGFHECWRVLKAGGEILIADAVFCASNEKIRNFYKISRFPALLAKPGVAVFKNKLFLKQPAVDQYQEIAERLCMPTETVKKLPVLPAFVFRAQKPKG